MYVPKGVAAGGASLAFLLLAAPARSASGIMPALFQRSIAPPSYTFHLDVAMAMRHFPWLHFHLEGVGIYQPGESYTVHFESVPWFVPKQQHDADLAMLDPLMWPSRYTFAQIGQRNDETLFELHAIDDAKLQSAIVAIGPRGRTRRVDATYSDGTHIEMQLSSSDVDGFFLPVTMSATIDEPHLALSANAAFKDYDFASSQSTRGTSR